MSSTPNPTHIPMGYHEFYQHIGVYPELARFRRFAPLWAKKLHDDISEVQACLSILNGQLASFPELGVGTMLDFPIRTVKDICPPNDGRFSELWDAWRDYDEKLVVYGQTLCQSEQIMKLPGQSSFHAKDVAAFGLPEFRPIFEDDEFVPTGEDAATYQDPSDRTDTCSWRGLPQQDFLTMCIFYISRWIECKVIRSLRRWIKGNKRLNPEAQTDIDLGKIVGVLDIFSCLVASILLALTVFVLAVVKSLKWRIVIIGFAGTTFGLSVKLMAGQVKRGEVFGAIAAFYAVSAVFVGSTNEKCVCG